MWLLVTSVYLVFRRTVMWARQRTGVRVHLLQDLVDVHGEALGALLLAARGRGLLLGGSLARHGGGWCCCDMCVFGWGLRGQVHGRTYVCWRSAKSLHAGNRESFASDRKIDGCVAKCHVLA